MRAIEDITPKEFLWVSNCVIPRAALISYASEARAECSSQSATQPS